MSKNIKINVKSPVKGYNRYQLLSCLQKDIRRGNEREALFWAAKLERLSWPMLWNRLEIIASEDVGPANPLLPATIKALRDQYEKAVERRSDSYRLFLTNAVLLLCRSPKSRVVDDLIWDVYWEIENNNLRLPVPDYAKDHHVKGGDKDKWLDEGIKLVNEADIENPYEDRARKNVESGKKLGSNFPLKRGKKKSKPTSPPPSIKPTQKTLTSNVEVEPDIIDTCIHPERECKQCIDKLGYERLGCLFNDPVIESEMESIPSILETIT